MRTLFYVQMICMITSVSAAGGENFQRLTQCVCVGDELVYQCTAVGSGSTVWRGSIFQCHSNEINLRHLQFPNAATGACNGQSLIAKSISVQDNRFTSQLNITSLTADMDNGTVICDYYDGASRNLIGNVTIELSKEVEPPTKLNITDYEYSVSENTSISVNVTVSWKEALKNCPSLRYQITSSTQCGNCPQESTGTTVTCTGLTQSQSACMISVQSVICNNQVGVQSDRLSSSISLRVPDVPNLVAIPHYNNDTSTLEYIKVNIFTDSEMSVLKFETNYTIFYTNQMSNISCGSATIPASTCKDGVCSHVFDISSSSCPPSTDGINVTAIGTNIFGVGMQSGGIIIDKINLFVRVVYMHHFNGSSINCDFKSNIRSVRFCDVQFGPCDEQQTEIAIMSNKSILSVQLPSIEAVKYCYNVTAGNGSFTVTVEGTFNPPKDPTITTNDNVQSNVRTIIGIAIGIGIAIIIAILTAAICGVLYYRKDRVVIKSELSTATHKLKRVSNKRFKVIDVNTKNECPIHEFLERINYSDFKPGQLFYEFINAEEDIDETKEVVLMKKSNIMYTGIGACKLIGAPGKSVKRPKLEGYRVFVQSGGIGRRTIKPKSKLLYDREFSSKTSTVDDLEFELFDGKHLIELTVDTKQDCNIQELLKQKNYDFKLGHTIYYEFDKEEKIAEDRRIILMDEKSKEIYTGKEAHKRIPEGIHTEMEGYKVFHQCEDIRKKRVKPGSVLLYDTNHLILEVTRNCELRSFIEDDQDLVFERGCAWFEFHNKTEDITRQKLDKLILMNNDSKQLLSGTEAQRVMKKKLKVKKNQPKPEVPGYTVFIKSFYVGNRFLSAGTLVLYQDPHFESNLREVDSNRFEKYDVMNHCSSGWFVETHVIQPKYAYFEFTCKEEYVTGTREVILMDKKTEKLYTGDKAREKIGATDTMHVKNPKLKQFRVFIQDVGDDGARFLNGGTILLYDQHNARKQDKKLAKSTKL